MGKHANERRENVIEGALQTLQLPLYNIDNFRDEYNIFLYKKKLDEKLGESSFESREGCYQHLLKCIHQAAERSIRRENVYE
jgi:hypothetical protein